MNGAHGLISQIGVGLPTTHPAEMAGQPSVERQAALVKRKSAQAGGQDLRGQGRKRDEAFLPYAVGAIHELPLPPDAFITPTYSSPFQTCSNAGGTMVGTECLLPAQ